MIPDSHDAFHWKQRNALIQTENVFSEPYFYASTEKDTFIHTHTSEFAIPHGIPARNTLRWYSRDRAFEVYVIVTGVDWGRGWRGIRIGLEDLGSNFCCYCVKQKDCLRPFHETNKRNKCYSPLILMGYTPW